MIDSKYEIVASMDLLMYLAKVDGAIRSESK